MSLLFDQVIEPKKSKTYLRLMLSIYLLTSWLICYSSIYVVLKVVFLGCIAAFLRADWRHANPCSDVKKIQFIEKQWVVEHAAGSKEHYLQGTILVSNFLFSLLQLQNSHQKKLIVLFHDQLSASQLRFLHFKTQDQDIGI